MYRFVLKECFEDVMDQLWALGMTDFCSVVDQMTSDGTKYSGVRQSGVNPGVSRSK